MKIITSILYLSFILSIMIFVSCGNNNQKDSSETQEFQSTIKAQDLVQVKIDSFKYEYTKQKFQLIIDSFPQLRGINGIIEHPDSAYFKYPVFVNEYTFGSEVGQDEFYLLYAYFLRQKNGDKYSKERDTLINIYRKLNEFYQELNRGGTYFGHMYERIVGYAEYDIYCLPQEKGNIPIGNFVKQKEKFIPSFDKAINNKIEESSYQGESINKVQLQEYVKDLNNMLTNEFYLSKADDFKKKHYNY